MLACVEQLPAKERQVLMLSAFEELTSVEIAAVLGITESSVRSRLFRARNLMAGLLQSREELARKEFSDESSQIQTRSQERFRLQPRKHCG